MLFVIGGTLDNGISSAVFGFNPISKAWQKFPNLLKARTCHRVVYAANEGAVVAVGGSNQWPSAGFGECEIMRLRGVESNALSWSSLPSLTHPRSCHGLSYFGGKIFACGGMMNPDGAHGFGIEQFDLTNSCEMLDLADEHLEWRAFPPLNLARFGLQLLPVEIGSKQLLLAIGGRGPNPLAEYCIEVFDLSSEEQKWTILEGVRLQSPRIDFAAAQMKQTLDAECIAKEGSSQVAPDSLDIVILGGNRVTRDERTDSSRNWEVLKLSLNQEGKLQASIAIGGRLPSSRVGCRATVLQNLVPGKQHLIVAGGFKAWGEGQTTYGGPLDQSVAVLELKSQQDSTEASGNVNTWVDFSGAQLGEELQMLPLKLHAPAVCAAA